MFRQAVACVLITALLLMGTLALSASNLKTANDRQLTVTELAHITGAGKKSPTAAIIGSLAVSFGLTAAVVGIAVLSGGVATPAVAAIYVGYIAGGVATAGTGWSAVWCGAGNC